MVALAGPAYDVFISYAREDTAWVMASLYEPLMRCRTGQGGPPQIFMDVGPEGLEPGQNWVAALGDALQQARTIIAVYSRTYFSKPMCEWELTKAFELDPIGKLGRLTPVLKEPDAVKAVPFRYSHIQFLDASRDDWFGRLCSRLKLTPPPGTGVTVARPVVSATGILTQIVGIGDGKDAAGRDVFSYAATPLPGLDSDATETIVPVKPGMFESQLARLHDRLIDLAAQAAQGAARSGGIESEAAALSRTVLPPTGLAGALTPGTHPQLELGGGLSSRVPWEALEEHYAWCPECQVVAGPDDRFCRRCGRKVESGGGRLSLTYHLTHVVRAPDQRPASGHIFLLACSAPDAAMRGAGRPDIDAHVDEIRRCLRAQSYEVEVLAGQDATAARLLDRLGDRNVVGAYVCAPYAADDEGRMALAMAGGALRAGDLEDTPSMPGFVFLNAIEAAPADPAWTFEPRPASLAQACARTRPGQLVIAAAWPLPAAQAICSAVEFFRRVVPDAAIAAAVDGMRRQSASRYDAGAPDVAWLGYRLFGNPNRPIPRPVARPTSVSATAADAPAAPRAFSEEGELNFDAFSCDLPDILLRAARRRFEQKRAHATVDDLVAGLVRRGHLTRAVLGALNVDADKVYAEIRAAADPEAAPWQETASTPGGAAPSERERIRALLARLMIRRRDEMTAGLAQVLDASGARTRTGTADSRITERDLLERALADAAWGRLRAAGLPDGAQARERLAAYAGDPAIDGNGSIRQDRLDSSARRVLVVAQTLAQEYGATRIPNRLVLAAFLARADGHAAYRLQRHGVDAAALRNLLLKSVSREKRRPVGLTVESCADSVAPMLRAALLGAGPQPVTEGALFAAFCLTAPPAFKEALKQIGLSLDAISGSTFA